MQVPCPGSLHDYIKSFLQPNDTNTLKSRDATLKLLQNREMWYQSGILTPSIPNAGGNGSRHLVAYNQSLFPFVNTCLKVLGIKEIIEALAVAGKQKFKITHASCFLGRFLRYPPCLSGSLYVTDAPIDCITPQSRLKERDMYVSG